MTTARRLLPRSRFATALVASLLLATPARADEAAADRFEKQIRPILIEHCVGCHGPEKAKSGLRLDERAHAFKGGNGGPVIVPGDPDNSPLIEAVRYDGATQMPPKGKLPQPAIAALEEWIRSGAVWPETRPAQTESGPAAQHWAFRPVQRPELPPVRDGSWARSPIDRFILAKLDAKGLAPSPPADRRTLIRRVYSDLLGLPPTPEEVEAFEADGAPDAYERLIDRMLASPRYGERWARHWLDVARYADTKGYVFFEDASYPWAYTYRDYVIRAFNTDLPYDRFILEQLAADRLDLGEDRLPLTAMGFLTAGGRFMNNPHDIIDDRIDVVTRGFLGLTVSCARCHDHKFDPIPQSDYYALYGVFASSIEPTVPPLFAPPPRTAEFEEFERELKRREEKLVEFVRGKHAALVASSKQRADAYLLAAHAARKGPAMGDFMLISDPNDLNPTMILRWQSYLERTRRTHDPVWVPWHALAGAEPAEFAARVRAYVRTVIDTPDPAKPSNPLIAEALRERHPESREQLAALYRDLLNRAEWLWQDYERRMALNGTPASALPDPAYEELRQAFHAPETPPQIPLDPNGDLLSLLPDRPAQDALQKLRKAVEEWRIKGKGAPPRAMTLEDKERPHRTRIFRRGNPGNLGEPVPRRFLTVLSRGEPKPFRNGSGRLELAQAIADPNNPLTARVLVNRIWMHHFGAPLVATPSDFGTRSDPPTHPELLDWLASELVAHGWSIKALHREILRSALYQQSSEDRSDATAVDPENTLYWRMNRRRLDFESLRDALVWTTGRLDATIGGPPVPDIVQPGTSRRTIYGHVDRLNLKGLYRAFDYPDPNASSPRRDPTTVPPQALFLMNHPFVQEAAGAVLKRPDVPPESDPIGRVERLYRICFQRGPTQAELELASDFIREGPDPWPRLVQVLLLTNEFTFVD